MAILVPALALAPLTTAAAAPDDGDTDAGAVRSTVGGELLGRTETQVLAGGDTPALPADLTAKSWIVADAETGDVLAAHDAHRPLAPASTLKMLFADTVMPSFDRDDLYRARPEHFAGMGEGSSAVGIADYQTYTVEDLWHGALLASGNDAVYALTAMNGGKAGTVEQMNARAHELQAGDTHVVNPDGYDAEGQTSSAYDLTLIARDALQMDDFREYVALPTADFPGAGEGEDRETYQIQNTDRLLVGAPGLEPYEGLAGVKNGYTSAAGHTFTGVAERGGRVLLVTVMDPEGDALAVYRESAALLDWGFAAAGSVDPVGELVPPLSELPDDPAPDDGAGQDATAGDGSDAALAGAAADDGAPVSGITVLMVTAAGLAVLAGAAYLFHRTHPLGARPGRRRTDGPPE
ncbi:serine hydrolase [Streptomyces sp. RFCAC02]|uniref:D-alanyl-D-alanine carboxypeptidase family protein n=1 Tax=Streptomyces sp. RFCAC02 TaxID=2499143 RepID=UPI00101FE03B|nr:serine hydrolase [Streptomyces sp. RFCAC02]